MSEPGESLRDYTRRLLEEIPVTRDGHLHMKHVGDGGYGRFAITDLASDVYLLHPKGEGEARRFDSIDAVIDAGWRVD